MKLKKGGEHMSNRMRTITILTVIFCVVGIFIHIPTHIFAEKSGEDKLVYIIPIEKEVERGLEAFLTRSVNEATEAGANHVIFEIDTPGGRVDSANKIGSLLQSMEIPSTAYIVNEALSAGSYIALNSDFIYMNPNATMGASGVITGDGNAADEKAQSAWIAAMKSAAESNDRDPLYAIAMADPEIDLPEYGAPKGKFLTLTPNDAVEVGYAEGIVQNRIELLHELDLSNATIVETETTFAEEIARFVTHPLVIPILLSIASLGLILELYSPGFGIPGTMGIISLLLFFYGHIIAGLAGMEAIILLIVGIILIILEFFVAGGILGLLGVGAILGSLFLAGYDLGHMSLSIAIAFIVAIIAAVILYKWVGAQRGIFRKLILRDRTTTDLGYVSFHERDDLIGKEGTALTPLRPAGTIVVEDERLDVISEGGFIEKGKSVQIVEVEGMKIVVRETL